MKLEPHAFILICLILLTSCKESETTNSNSNFNNPEPSLETKKMVRRLQTIAESTDPMSQLFMNEQRIKILEALLQSNTGSDLKSQYQFAIESLRAGNSEAAVKGFREILDTYSISNKKIPDTFEKQLKKYLAISLMRIGEQSNCIMLNSSESCLFPLSPKAVHLNQQGSREAMIVLTELLEQNPDDLVSKWLINIAAQTIGEHPNSIPEKWQIPTSTFDSVIKMPAFINKAPNTNSNIIDLAGGSITDDFNADGYLDIIASAWGTDSQLVILINDQNGKFIDLTKQSGLTGLTGGLNLVQADYDNDGDIDVLVLRGAWLLNNGHIPNSLLQNDGNGLFSDVTESSGLLSFHPSQTASWGDYDNDGYLDLFIGNESLNNDLNPSELFHNNGDGTFTEVAKQVGIDTNAYVKGAVWGDFNNDNLLDLYISNMDKPNQLFKNISTKDITKFIDIAETAGVSEPIYSFPTWFWDFNNDGLLDIFVADYNLEAFISNNQDKSQAAQIINSYLTSNPTQTSAKLFQNNGDETFKDVTKERHLNIPLLAMGANFGDIDNDGYLDIYIGTGDPDFNTILPNRMFRNNNGSYFQDVTTTNNVGHLQKGHAVSFADLDNDGDQDIYAVLGGAYSGDFFQNALFENPGHNNHWITIRLVGTESNRSAIGAKVDIYLDDEPKRIHRIVSSGGSFGANSLQLEIGLNKSNIIKELIINWPSGRLSNFKNVAANQIIQIVENSDTIHRIELKHLNF
jgi:hypothetical protein